MRKYSLLSHSIFHCCLVTPLFNLSQETALLSGIVPTSGHLYKGWQKLVLVLGLFSRSSWLIWGTEPQFGQKDFITLGKASAPAQRCTLDRLHQSRLGMSRGLNLLQATCSPEIQLLSFLCAHEGGGFNSECKKAVLQPAGVMFLTA